MTAAVYAPPDPGDGCGWCDLLAGGCDCTTPCTPACPAGAVQPETPAVPTFRPDLETRP